MHMLDRFLLLRIWRETQTVPQLRFALSSLKLWRYKDERTLTHCGTVVGWLFEDLQLAIMNELRSMILAFLLSLTTLSAAEKLPQPLLTYSKLPQYPGLAIATHTEGTVKLSFLLDEKGEVIEVRVISGPKLLADAAIEDVKSWRFSLPHDLFRTEWRYETEFVYRFSGKEVGTYEAPKLTVSLTSFDRIEVVSDAVAPVRQVD